MEDIKYGQYIEYLITTKRKPRVRQGIYAGELITTKRQARVRQGIGLNTILREIVIENEDIKSPRSFPLEYSWTKNI